jgi:hypothetical protein
MKKGIGEIKPSGQKQEIGRIENALAMTDEMKLYTMPENYLRRQQWTAFLAKNGYAIGDCSLACWYIGPQSGRLIGVYLYLTVSGRREVRIKSWCINRDQTLEFHGEDKVSFNEIYTRLRESPESHCTDYMPFFIGIASDPPPKPEGRVIPFQVLA